MTTEKRPNKTIYSDQKKVHDFIVKKVKSEFLKNVQKAYLIGSLSEGRFGVYDKKYEGFQGSDIDLVIIPKGKLHKSWIHQGKGHDWHDKYFGGKIEFNRTIHPISFIIPFKNDISLFFKKAKELNWKLERLK